MTIKTSSDVVGYTADGVKIVMTQVVTDNGDATTVPAQINKLRVFKDWTASGTGYFVSCTSGTNFAFATGATTVSSPNVISVTNAGAGVATIQILLFGV